MSSRLRSAVRCIVPWLCLSLPSAAQAKADQPPAATTLLGSPAPPFTRKTLEGSTLALKSLRGHVVVLNFWASWCGPCLAEMPVFARWRTEERARGLEVIGISMDDAAAPAEQVLHRLKLSYPLLLGDATLAQAYGGVLGLPVTFLIDRQGVVRRRFDGVADLDAMHRQVEELLH